MKLLAIYTYLFDSKRSTEVNWRIYSNHITPQGTKEEQEKSLQHICFPVNFAEFLRISFLRTPPVAASEDEHDETKLLHITSRLNKCYLWMIRLRERVA